MAAVYITGNIDNDVANNAHIVDIGCGEIGPAKRSYPPAVGLGITRLGDEIVGNGVIGAKNINGVGAKKAQAIVKYRQLNGPFKSIDDLLNVKGIGQKIIDKNKADIHFSDASTKTGKKKTVKN